MSAVSAAQQASGQAADETLEHWANRDDLGMARQLGWIPPTPAYLFKMARAKRS